MVLHGKTTNRSTGQLPLIMSKSGQAGGPERAIASRRHPIMPNEIFLEIFGYIQVSVELGNAECKNILSQLSLVCHFFCTTLRPRLFRSLQLEKIVNPRSMNFCQALIHGDVRAQALAIHIRDCRVSRRAVSAKTCYQVLRWAPNIERLELERSSGIGVGFWRVIGKLPKLKNLHISSASFRGDIPAKEVDCIARLQVSSLEICNSQVFSLPQVLDLTALSTLRCFGPSALCSLLASGPIPTLETLFMDDSISMRSLMNALSKVPSVRNFTIYSSKDPVGVISQDFSALLKNLCSLTCSLPFLALLAPGRPLVSLHVLDRNSPPLDLGTILGSCGPNTTIRDLEIPSTITPVTASDFPCLRNLKLKLDLGLDYEAKAATWVTLIVDACDKWAVSPSVQWLHILVSAKFLMENLALQHAMLTGSLLQIFPALQQFELGHATWERFNDSEAWQVLIPACHRTGIIARFKAGDPCVVDHDGFLQRLSARHDLL